MNAALAFLPPQDVVNSFDELCVVIRNYVSRFCWNAPTPTPFSNALLYFLSSYGRCSIEPTKSCCEQKMISSLDITVSKQTFRREMFYRDVLSRAELFVLVRMLQNQAGHAPEPQRSRYADCNTRILRIADIIQTGKLWAIFDKLLITFPWKIL